MGNITQCPQCRTRFRVVPDQLKLSEGWVRCGQCSEVFEAHACMVDAPEPTPAPVEAPVQEPLALLVDPPPSFAVTAELPPEIGQVSPGRERQDHSPQVWWAMPEPPHAATSLPGESPPAPPVAPVAPVAPAEFFAPVEAAATAPTTSASTPAPAAPDVAAPVAPAVQADEPPEVSFVRQARREAFWAQTWVRVAQAGTALGLALLLLLQVALHQRDWLAAAHPAWAPWLAALCQPLDCAVGPLHQIESVLIDSSALVDLKEGRYRLEVTFNNTSAHRLALPALELSLTNLRDEVVVRKVIGPHDWSQPTTDLPARAELPLSVQLALSNAGEWRMSGYRAVIFYP